MYKTRLIIKTLRKLFTSTDSDQTQAIVLNNDIIQWWRIVPFVILHAACFSVFWVGFSRTAFFTFVFSYCIRIFAIGAVYHRYLAHRCYKMNRFWQFIMVFIATSSTQRGPLWWAAHHRYHHQHTEHKEDPHSPIQRHPVFSHMGWIYTERNYYYDRNKVKDWLKFPELVWLDRYDLIPTVIFCLGLYAFGTWLNQHNPELHTSGWQCLVWGYVVATILVFHATVSINSLGHLYGRRRYKTKDNSRNNWLLSLLTFGEGWHNNHHYYPMSVRQGFYWYEIDITYYILLVFSWVGIVKELRVVPTTIRDKREG